jgi:hypothetical protein
MLFDRVSRRVLVVWISAWQCKGGVLNAYGVGEYLEIMRIFLDRLGPVDMVLEHIIIHCDGFLSRLSQHGVIEQPKGVKIKTLRGDGSMIDSDVRKKREEDIAERKLDVGISSSHNSANLHAVCMVQLLMAALMPPWPGLLGMWKGGVLLIGSRS